MYQDYCKQEESPQSLLLPEEDRVSVIDAAWQMLPSPELFQELWDY